MKANYKWKCPTEKMPSNWFKLYEWERQEISKLCNDSMNQQIDHEEAELQKVWLQIMCIVLHRQKDPYGEMRCLATLKDFKTVYRFFGQFATKEERDAWLKVETDKIFRRGGYPHEWVDSLENGGRR